MGSLRIMFVREVCEAFVLRENHTFSVFSVLSHFPSDLALSTLHLPTLSSTSSLEVLISTLFSTQNDRVYLFPSKCRECNFGSRCARMERFGKARDPKTIDHQINIISNIQYDKIQYTKDNIPVIITGKQLVYLEKRNNIAKQVEVMRDCERQDARRALFNHRIVVSVYVYTLFGLHGHLNLTVACTR